MALPCIKLHIIPPSIVSYLRTGLLKIYGHYNETAYACNILTWWRSLQKSSSQAYTVKYGIFYLHCQSLPVTPTWSRDHFSDALSAIIPNVLKFSPVLQLKSEMNLIWILWHPDPFWEYHNIHWWAYVNQQGVRHVWLLEISWI